MKNFWVAQYGVTLNGESIQFFLSQSGDQVQCAVESVSFNILIRKLTLCSITLNQFMYSAPLPFHEFDTGLA